MYSRDYSTSTSCPIWDLHVRMNLYRKNFYFLRVNSRKHVHSSPCWDLPFITWSEIFWKHIGHSSSHMLTELFKQFLIDKDTPLKAVKTFNIAIRILVCIKWTSNNYANNNLGTSNHASISSDSEIHLLSVVSFYVFQFCHFRAARFLESRYLIFAGFC